MLESRQIAWPAYLVSFALIVIPLADAGTSLFPWRFSDARWRFGAIGLMSNSLLIPMTGLLIAFLTAAMLDHRRLRRVIAVVSLVAATISLAALVLFALDALQTRAAVRPEMRLSFSVASMTAALKTLLAAATFLAIGWSALRDRRGKVGERKPSDVPLFSVGVTAAEQAKVQPPAT